MHRNCQDWLRYRHITYRTESENMNIVSESARYSIHLRESITWSACGNGQKKNEEKKEKE